MHDRSYNIGFNRIKFHLDESGLFQYTVYAENNRVDRVGTIEFAFGFLRYRVHGTSLWVRVGDGTGLEDTVTALYKDWYDWIEVNDKKLFRKVDTLI